MVIPVSKIGWASWVATPEKVEAPDTLSVLPRVAAPTACKVLEADIDPAKVVDPDTLNVLPNVEAPTTSRVLDPEIEPVATIEATDPVPVTLRVLAKVAAPETSSVLPSVAAPTA